MIPLTFFPILGGFYACLHIFGAFTYGWGLVTELVQNPTPLDAVCLVESIVSLLAHVVLIVGILKVKAKYVTAFKIYFLVFVAQLSVLIVIKVSSMPNQNDYFWLEITLIYMVIFGLPIFLLIIWMLNGVLRYVEHEGALREILENNLESSYDKQNLL